MNFMVGVKNIMGTKQITIAMTTTYKKYIGGSQM